MSTYDKSGVSAAQADAARRALVSLLKEEANRRCAECGARGPTWASVNLGVFVCLNCSGIHRSLGTHISKVRSATLDTWLPAQVAWAGRMGNTRAAGYWEARLPPGFARPVEGDMAALSTFIGAKYRDRAYASTVHGPPPTLDNHDGHPYLAGTAGGGNGGRDDGGSAGGTSVPLVHTSGTPVPAAAPAAPTATAAAAPPPPRPAPELIDLLGMHEEPMPVVAAPAAAWQQQAPAAAAPPPAAWAAFNSAPPAPTAPAAAGSPAAIADHDWDIFQAAAPAMVAAFAPGRGGAVGAAPPPPPVPAPPRPAPAASRPDHTAAIMRMFDAVPGSSSVSASSPGGSGRRAGPLLPDLSNGGRGTPALAPFGGAPFLKSPAPHLQQQQAPSAASPTGRGF